MSWLLVIIAVGIALYLKFGDIDKVTKRNLVRLGGGLLIIILLLVLMLMSLSTDQ